MMMSTPRVPDELRQSEEVHWFLRELPRLRMTIISGSCAAVMGTYVKHPIQRIKWLRQVSEHGSLVEQNSVISTLRSIIRNEGFFRGLWRGSVATIIRNVPHASVVYTMFPVYFHAFTDPKSALYMERYASNSSERKNLAVVRATAGAAASMTTSLITHPLDTVRVRVATQFYKLNYVSVPQTIRKIWTQEGVGAFYRGMFVSLIGTIVRGGVGFGIYETLKSEEYFDLENRRASNGSFNLSDSAKRLGVGFFAGFWTTFMCQPIDTLRRRQQVFSRRRHVTESELANIGGRFGQTQSTAAAIRFILETEGPLGFYKGMGLGLIKSPIAIAVSFTVNDFVKHLLGWQNLDKRQ